ncbi:MAG: sugar phosphate isomerase/epimerase [Oscillospiraceae bacterium]|jgi:fatty-acyl-CoA synthase|nr:sugar phosphate isomerase/epimerase [Oscillospiraceae bacterium]
MKLSFSTVGCPNWRWNEVLAAASDLGYDGIELRGLGEELKTPSIDLFSPARVSGTRGELAMRGLSVFCLASDVLLHSEDGNALVDAGAYIELARALGTPYVRVLCDSWGEPGPVDEDLVYKRLRALAPAAAAASVTLLVETNGVWSDTGKLKQLLGAVDSSAVAALWDVNHPVRNFGETVQTTWNNIGPYVRHVHLKDSVSENGKTVYKLLGYGDLPLREALSRLKGVGFDGALSMEWVKRWNAELEDAGIVFAHYVYQVKKLWQEA